MVRIHNTLFIQPYLQTPIILQIIHKINKIKELRLNNDLQVLWKLDENCWNLMRQRRRVHLTSLSRCYCWCVNPCSCGDRNMWMAGSNTYLSCLSSPTDSEIYSHLQGDLIAMKVLVNFLFLQIQLSYFSSLSFFLSLILLFIFSYGMDVVRLVLYEWSGHRWWGGDGVR